MTAMTKRGPGGSGEGNHPTHLPWILIPSCKQGHHRQLREGAEKYHHIMGDGPCLVEEIEFDLFPNKKAGSPHSGLQRDFLNNPPVPDNPRDPAVGRPTGHMVARAYIPTLFWWFSHRKSFRSPLLCGLRNERFYLTQCIS